MNTSTQTTTLAAEVWTAPRLVRLGTISDVRAKGNFSAQGNMGAMS